MGRGAASYFGKADRALLAFVVLLLTNGAAISTSLEYAVKATYLYKFVPFVKWPSASFSSPDSPITICVFGKDPFGQTLDQAVLGQRVEGRELVVRRISEITANSGCHIIYIGEPADPAISRGLDILRGQPVLTVSDSSANPTGRGIVNFVVEDNKVRFEIDERAAEQNHLAISSKLLSLAKTK